MHLIVLVRWRSVSPTLHVVRNSTKTRMYVWPSAKKKQKQLHHEMVYLALPL